MHGTYFLSRRRFLQAGLGAACGAFFPGVCLAAHAMDPAEQARRAAEFGAMRDGVARLLAPGLGRAAAREAADDSAARFEELLPALPYIGGAATRNQENLIQAAWLIALTKAVKAKGFTADVAGRGLYD
ncbi:MAG: hypothetical protein HQK82_11840, partial [Desulfovibrionaceae bacterium]|nr:hypothetical protein [Desulfovibrionaceae bacterium]